MWARRAGVRGYEPWAPDADGRWASAALGIAFAPQGLLLRVYDQDGALVPPADEAVAQRDEERRRVAALEAELRRLRGA